jgi:hypothetical protein
MSAAVQIVVSVFLAKLEPEFVDNLSWRQQQ